MLKKLTDSLLDKIKNLKSSTLLLYIILFIVSCGLMGTLLRSLFENIGLALMGRRGGFRPLMLLEGGTWFLGAVVNLVLASNYAINGGFGGMFRGGLNLLSGKGAGEKDRVEGSLENSRFLTDKERDKYFPVFTYETLAQSKVDGVPARAVLNKRGKLEGNWKPGVHALVIGATGSGKTTTFINPMIQCIAATNCGSSMIMTDPKGELFDLHSGFLKERGYEVLVLDLRDTYSSSRWNPLEPIWDAYQQSLHAGDGMRLHLDDMDDYPDLRRLDGYAEYGEPWVEWKGAAYADLEHCRDDISVAKQKVFDEMYEDLQDLVGGLVPITNEKDQMWERGARSLVTAVCLAMLEDSEKPELGMTKEKFNLFNVNKAISNSDNNYKALKDYFEGRGALSQAYQLSRQVLTAPDNTMSSYLSVTLDKRQIIDYVNQMESERERLDIRTGNDFNGALLASAQVLAESPPDALKVVLLLTDGGGSLRDDVQRLYRDPANELKLFSICITNDPNYSGVLMFQSLAEDSGGLHTVLSPSDPAGIDTARFLEAFQNALRMVTRRIVNEDLYDAPRTDAATQWINSLDETFRVHAVSLPLMSITFNAIYE